MLNEIQTSRNHLDQRSHIDRNIGASVPFEKLKQGSIRPNAGQLMYNNLQQNKLQGGYKLSNIMDNYHSSGEPVKRRQPNQNKVHFSRNLSQPNLTEEDRYG